MVNWVDLDGVRLQRRGRDILGPLSLSLGPRGVTVVMGQNGAGKTSFLRALHGLEKLSGGSIRWAGGAPSRRAQAFVFQNTIIMRRSVLDNIA